MTDTPFLADGYHALAPGKLANVVTYLEVDGKPDRPRRPVPEGVTLEAIDSWEPDEFLALYKQIGWEWLWSGRLQLGRDRLEGKLAEPTLRSWCPVKNGRRVGLLEMDLKHPEETELSYFGLVPDAIGAGIGGWLIEQAIEIAFARAGVRRLWLHTCTFDSPQALPFYMRMGFVPYARAVEVHDDLRLLGRIDERAGPHVPLIRNARRPDIG